MNENFTMMRRMLDDACAAGIISKPHPIKLPAALPFHAAVASVALPDGCTAPSGTIPLRAGSGIGPTAEVAGFLAMAEAAERYSLQYNPVRPPVLKPFLTVGGPAEDFPLVGLTLGAPGHGDSDSRGGAAGFSLVDASARALYELLERHHVHKDGALVGPFHQLVPDTIPCLSLHLDFLSDQLRILKVAVMVSPLGYIVARALCQDVNGGRSTMGSASAADFEEAVRRSTEEAVFTWRNMVEIEARGVQIPAPGTLQGDAVRMYRGAAPVSFFSPDACFSRAPVTPVADAPLAETVKMVTGRRVRMFDMTSPSLNIAVVRAILD